MAHAQFIKPQTLRALKRIEECAAQLTWLLDQDTRTAPLIHEEIRRIAAILELLTARTIGRLTETAE